jgi:hypothetical protein
MSDALEHHYVTVNIAGRTITYLRFAVDIDRLAETEEEFVKLIEHLN